MAGEECGGALECYEVRTAGPCLGGLVEIGRELYNMDTECARHVICHMLLKIIVLPLSPFSVAFIQ